MRSNPDLLADTLERVLDAHGVEAFVDRGMLTQRWIIFEVVPAIGTKISKIKRLDEEIASALGADTCRIQRRGVTVNVEVPRPDPQPVHLLPMLDKLQREAYPNGWPAATATLGIDERGGPLLIRLPSPDIAHVLVAGMTGSGKTVLLHDIILSLAMTNSPTDLELVVIDPKYDQFTAYNRLPHLGGPVGQTTDHPGCTFRALVRAMEQRQTGQLPHTVVVIDELADLLMTSDDEVQELLTRLLQRGRSVGIHVIAATQKPTSSVLGSLLKANFPVRLVGKVSSANDARVASGWSGTGAERLEGRGDFIAVATGRTQRFQAAYVKPSEIQETVDGLANGNASFGSEREKEGSILSWETVQRLFRRRQ
jgi:S-DNA-T family DNA segregation ATPase FtsK/SpoIIIE